MLYAFYLYAAYEDFSFSYYHWQMGIVLLGADDCAVM
jgi:hypothetical protein